MNFGLCSFCYRWSIGRPYYRPKHPMTIEAFAEKVKEYGLHEILLCNNCELEFLPDERLNSLQKYCQDNSINIQLGSRGNKAESFRRMIDIAEKMHAKVLRVSYEDDEAYGSKSIRKCITDCFREAIKYAEDAGVVLAYENSINMRYEDIVGIISDVGSDYFGACLDTMNCAYWVYRPEEEFDYLLPYAKMVHFKDYAIVPNKRGFVIAGKPMGEGCVDFKGLTKRLIDADYKGNIYLELYIDRTDDETQTYNLEDATVRQSIEYARTIGLL